MSKHSLMGKLTVVHHSSVQSPECSETPAWNNLNLFFGGAEGADLNSHFLSASLAVGLSSQSLSWFFATSGVLLLSVFRRPRSEKDDRGFKFIQLHVRLTGRATRTLSVMVQ